MTGVQTCALPIYSGGRKDVDLWVHAKQKLGLLHFWYVFFLKIYCCHLFYISFIKYVQRIYLKYIKPHISTLFKSHFKVQKFVVDHRRSSLLNWRKLFKITIGIARGTLYLHQDSRLRIIHRDLKTSNVLLDAEMNPKISEFGIVRIFKGDQIQDNTTRVVGT